MKPPVIESTHHDEDLVASLNRQRLRDAGVFAVSVVGGPGCGKTSLIDATIERLSSDLNVGVIACDVTSHLDADRIARRGGQVVQVNTGGRGAPEPGDIHDALRCLELDWLDLLFIENVGGLVGAAGLDLGQSATAAVFSVAGGHDKARKHPAIVQSAALLVLNKTDLLATVPFDLAAFRADVRRLNATSEMFELSALQPHGLDGWLDWLKSRARKRPVEESIWFG